MIKILIADDHKMFADGVESILSDEAHIEIIAKCYEGYKIFHELEKQQPDIILLDVNLPDMSGIQVCEKLKKEYPHIKVLALSMFNEESFITQMLDKGAAGYILKNTGKEELTKAIRLIQSGQSYFSQEVTQTIMNGLMQKNKATSKTGKAFPKISRREKQVLKLIIDEHTTQEIADKLFISLKTVESHRSSLLNKMNARNTAGLVRITLENQLLD